MRTSRKGFTLIELLVVITIMIILAALLLPAYVTAQQKIHAFRCISNLHQIGQAAAMYRGDNDDLSPIGAYRVQWPESPHWDRSWHDLLLPYLDHRPGLFFCPLVNPRCGHRYSYGCNPWISGYYRVNSLLGGDASRLLYVAEKATNDWPCLPRWHHDDPGHSYLTARHIERLNVLFCDSHIRSLDPSALDDASLWIPR